VQSAHNNDETLLQAGNWYIRKYGQLTIGGLGYYSGASRGAETVLYAVIAIHPGDFINLSIADDLKKISSCTETDLSIS
jgi:hypothetical protein